MMRELDASTAKQRTSLKDLLFVHNVRNRSEYKISVEKP